MHRLRSDFRLLILSAIIAVAFSTEARSTGIYEDAVGRAGFISSPWRPSVRARINVTDSDSTTASTVVFAANMKVTSWFLLQVEQPYITASLGQQVIESGFGDLRFRGQFRLWHGGHRRLAMEWELGTGTGTTKVFPYATQSLELVAGVAWVDTLEVLEYWAEAAYEKVNRRPDDIIIQRVLVDFSRFAAGVGLPMGPVGLRVGSSFLLFRGGSTREVFFAQLTWDHRPHFRFFGSAQVEGGKSENRVSDATAGVGMIVYF